MAGRCVPCSSNRRSTFRISADGTAPDGDAAQAAAGAQYEVLDSSGRPTGRRFASLVAATSYAGRIGGSTRPA